MDLSEQLKNLRYANFYQLAISNDQSIFDLYNLMRRLEEFFKEQSEIA